jgi:hypothetical protein
VKSRAGMKGLTGWPGLPEGEQRERERGNAQPAGVRAPRGGGE